MRRLVAVLCLLFAALTLHAQSADQEVTSATALPEPVAPGATLTYTVNLTNHGPDPATNGGFNGVLPANLLSPVLTPPAGFTCFTLGQNISCITPSFAAGSSVTLTITGTVDPSLIAFADGQFSALFSPSGTTTDPNNGNNQKTVVTHYVTPDVDMAVTASDSPDPVTPNQNVTYTINVTNNGPDPAQNPKMSVVYNGGTFTFVSMAVPAGWNCPAGTVGAAPNFTCTAASQAASATSTFTLVVKADPAVIGVIDSNIQQVFTTGSDNHDTNHANEAVTVSTFYDAPNVDLAITASDSPDPVFPDGNITYTVTVTNNGPDAAQNATMNVPLNNTLLFQSVTTPAGWNCPTPPVNSGASFTCTAATLAASNVSVFTVVLKAAQSQFGANPGTINQVFTTGNAWADPNNNNNAVTVSTQYLPAVANLSVTAGGTPGTLPVGSNITYTGTLGNAGPDAAPSAHFTVALDSRLLYQSINVPAGYNCTGPAVGATGIIDCINASLAVTGSPLAFQLVVQVAPSLLNTAGGTITQHFTVSTAVSDPNLNNNDASVTTTYTTPHADLVVTNSDAPDPVATGANITYTQTVTNNGPDGAANVTFSEAIGSGVTFQSLTAAPGFNCTAPAVNGTGNINCTIAAMANAAVANFTVVVKVTAASGTVSNTAVGSSANYDPAPGNNSATAATTIQAVAVADLTLTKTTTATQALTGSTLTYTITAHNNGPASATNVTVVDDLPNGLQFVSATPSQGTCNAADPISCNLGTLANGATATVTVLAKVTASTGTIVNTASVSATESDPNPGNGTAGTPALPAQPATSEVPALGEWALMALAVMLGGLALMKMR
jgi:uncharacterized repeat protein (TIGR01451 family)